MAFHLNKDLKSKLVRVLVCLVVTLTLPLFIFNAIICTLYRYFVVLTARIFRPDLQKQLSGVQGGMSLEDIFAKPKINILVYYILDAPVTTAQFRSRFQKRVLSCLGADGNLLYPELRQVKTTFMNYFFLRDDPKFDLKNHVRDYDYEGSLALRQPCTEEDLQRVMGGLLARPWKKGQSPWEILVVRNYQSDGETEAKKTAIVVRLHHSLADGYSILKITIRMMDNNGIKVPQPTMQPPSLVQKCAGLVAFPFLTVYYLAVLMIDGYDPKQAWHLTDVKLSKQYNSCIVKRIPVATLKAIRKKYGVNYNAVLAAVVCGGIRRVMQDAGQEVPKSMAVFMPVPLPNHPEGLVIHAGGMYVPFPLQVASPMARLQLINSSMNRRSMHGQMLASTAMESLLKYIPICLGRVVHNKMQCTAAFSSFPAAIETPEACGIRLIDAMFAFGLPCGQVGATVTLLSLGEGQRIVVNVDKTVYGDADKLHKLSDYVHAEIDKLMWEEDGVV